MRFPGILFASRANRNPSLVTALFYGIQTLRKSLPVVQGEKVALPAVEIIDEPRFNYRGGMLDVARHYCTLDSVKRFIDMLAMHNINRFHWHLSEDQGSVGTRFLKADLHPTPR